MHKFECLWIWVTFSMLGQLETRGVQVINCDAPSAQQGHEAQVTCNFNSDVDDLRPLSRAVDLYSKGNGSVPIMECIWLSEGEPACKGTTSGYTHSIQSDKIVLRIAAASAVHMGNYVCQQVSRGMDTSTKPCFLFVNESQIPQVQETTTANDHGFRAAVAVAVANLFVPENDGIVLPGVFQGTTSAVAVVPDSGVAVSAVILSYLNHESVNDSKGTPKATLEEEEPYTDLNEKSASECEESFEDEKSHAGGSDTSISTKIIASGSTIAIVIIFSAIAIYIYTKRRRAGRSKYEANAADCESHATDKQRRASVSESEMNSADCQNRETDRQSWNENATSELLTSDKMDDGDNDGDDNDDHNGDDNVATNVPVQHRPSVLEEIQLLSAAKEFNRRELEKQTGKRLL